MKKNEDFIKEIEKKFIRADKFAHEIECMIRENPDYNYINAIIEYCESHSIEPELIAKIIPQTLKEKIKKDATRLNYLKRTTKAKLPV
jgi:hypothetical protein